MLPVLIRPLGSKKAVLCPPLTRYARRASANEEAFAFAKPAPGKTPLLVSAAEAPPLTDPAAADPVVLVLAAGPAAEAVFANKPVHSFGAALTGAGAGSDCSSDCAFSSEGAAVPVGLSNDVDCDACFCSGDVSSEADVLLASLAFAFGITGRTGTAGTAARDVALLDLGGVAVVTVLVWAVETDAGVACEVDDLVSESKI